VTEVSVPPEGIRTPVHKQESSLRYLNFRFATHLKYVDGKVKIITFGPTTHFHGLECFDLILEILRGANEASVDLIPHIEGFV
jgi:hypothetical protein